jgi:hypothetical protein
MVFGPMVVQGSEMQRSDSFWKRYKFVLYPVLVIVILLGTMLILTEGSTVVPSIYALF